MLHTEAESRLPSVAFKHVGVHTSCIAYVVGWYVPCATATYLLASSVHLLRSVHLKGIFMLWTSCGFCEQLSVAIWTKGIPQGWVEHLPAPSAFDTNVLGLCLHGI
jgi:hypothetical protein